MARTVRGLSVVFMYEAMTLARSPTRRNRGAFMLTMTGFCETKRLLTRAEAKSRVKTVTSAAQVVLALGTAKSMAAMPLRAVSIGAQSASVSSPVRISTCSSLPSLASPASGSASSSSASAASATLSTAIALLVIGASATVVP